MEQLLIKDAIPDHPLLRGRKEIGRGEYTIVVEGDTVDGEERVIKLLSSPADYAFHTADDRPRGRHFPIVYADLGVVGKASNGYPFHAVEVERLYHLSGSNDAVKTAAKITTAYFDACSAWSNLARDMGRIALHHIVVTPMGWSSAISESLGAIESFSEEYGTLPDLMKSDNIMVRKDGTLVFSDPVFIG